MSNTCGCRPHRSYGFTLIQHTDPCPDAPAGVCGACGHDVVPGEDHEHELCAAA